MRKFLFGLFLAIAATPAFAQDVTQKVGVCDPTPYVHNCLKPSSDGSIPIGAAGAVAVAGTQVGLSIASATALTIPTGATLAVIEAQGTNNSSGICLYWRDDGTNPTNAAGQALSALATLTYKVTNLPIKLIAASGATCTATISYYQ